MVQRQAATMFLVYGLLLTLGFLVLLPRFLVDVLRHGKYVGGFKERLGIIDPLSVKQPVIWLHCVSVGETQAARPLVEALRHQFPDYQFVISTTTVTGQRLAREVFKGSAARIIYFPFDWTFSTKRALERINPAAVLLMETEIWPGFLRQCSLKRVSIVIVNGRLSDHSFRRYSLARSFIARVLRTIDLAVMQSEEDANRIRALGLPEEKIFVSGNLKFDAGTIPLDGALSETLRSQYSSPDRPLLVAASTHAPEERILIEAFRELINGPQRPRLLIAPRHPERFAEVASLMESSGLSWIRRTSGEDPDADLILFDTIGELTAVYPLAQIVFVGGSISKNGGHNILEPAAVGSCIITGPYTFNFKGIVKAFVAADAIVQLPQLQESGMRIELVKVFSSLMADPNRRLDLGRRAKLLLRANQGATKRTLGLIAPILAKAAKQKQSLTPTA